jgi:threonine/homoserine/homoserine lactone efflux protein
VDLQLYLVFVLASIVLCIVPGPDMLLILGKTLSDGKRAGYLTSIGINVGAYVHLIVAISGLTAIVVSSAWAFMAIKFAGAAYLIYLGLGFLSQPMLVRSDTIPVPKVSNRSNFWHGFLSDVLNPKVALFYLTVLPQFISANAENPFYELILLGVTLNLVGLITNCLTVLLSDAIARKLTPCTTISNFLQRTLGLLLIGIGMKLANEKSYGIESRPMRLGLFEKLN